MPYALPLVTSHMSSLWLPITSLITSLSSSECPVQVYISHLDRFMYSTHGNFFRYSWKPSRQILPRSSYIIKRCRAADSSMIFPWKSSGIGTLEVNLILICAKKVPTFPLEKKTEFQRTLPYWNENKKHGAPPWVELAGKCQWQDRITLVCV